ncbi:protein FMP32, mitochondrial-like [Primulina huaijiensis]|uniref:protein FMP32, mitochondrial-like n=1 Tax=Primulina huaijiensis TaxID=1492673 RepID=UPI003CC71FB7
MTARKLAFQSWIRLLKFQEINAGGLAVNGPQPGRFSVKSYGSLSSNSSGYRLYYRQISKLVKANGRRVYLVDTLALVRSLEAQGIPSKHAEAITSAMTEVLDDSLENISQNLISRAEMQRIEMAQEANLSNFKSEIQSSQGHHFSLLQREAEKLRNDIEKMRGELRYEIDKATAGQRLDLNLERGRIRDELANQSAETANLTNKLDREIHELRAQLEAAKYDVIKYCIGTLVSISAVGIGMIRIFASKQ